MGDSTKIPPSSEKTLIDQDGERDSTDDDSPTRVTPITSPASAPPSTAGRPKTSSAALAQESDPETLDPSTPAVGGKWPTHGPLAPPSPPPKPIPSEKRRISGKQQSLSAVPAGPPKPPPDSLRLDTDDEPLPTTAPAGMPEFVDLSTRLKPMAHRGGPFASADADSVPDLKPPGASPSAGGSGEEVSSGGAPTPALQSNSGESSGGRLGPYKPMAPTQPFAGLDEIRFRRTVWGLAGGAVFLVVVTFFWVMVKYDDRPVNPGEAKPIVGSKAPKPVVARKAPAEAPAAVAIDQTVDAGAAETRTAAMGRVRIVADPEASVFVDGEDLGLTPVMATLPAGKNAVVLENKRLRFKRAVTVDVTAGEQTAVKFTFSTGWIEVDAPKDSKVTIDGRPVSGTHIQLWEGSHKVEVVHADKKKTRGSRTVEVAAGMTTSVHFDDPAIEGD